MEGALCVAVYRALTCTWAQFRRNTAVGPAVAVSEQLGRILEYCLQLELESSICASMASKFNVHVAKCSGAVVVGDHANLTIGAPVRGGKCGDFNYLFSSSDSDVSGFHSGKERVAVGTDGSGDSINL